MAEYCVNKKAQITGEHEVHKMSCDTLPAKEHQLNLGKFDTCQEAVRAAKKYYDNVDGCKNCSPSCHKK